MPKVLVIGSTGMLGSTVVKYLVSKGLAVEEANRQGQPVHSENVVHRFDAERDSAENLFNKSDLPDYVVNCVGLIKQKIEPNSSSDILRAISINSSFPINLTTSVEALGIKLIQIATDCVYSGTKGGYTEQDVMDPVDVYGYSKALGEIGSNNSMIIRCSIIGKELDSSKSLLNWVLSQNKSSNLNGYVNHFWNGVTTYHFAKICHGIMTSNGFNPGVIHLIPADSVSKFELISKICTIFDRSDISVHEHEDVNFVDRTLKSVKRADLLELWASAGYQSIPTIEEMIREYSTWTYNS
jgi:dTDP-4-dehydrorhamnose reductase